MGSSILFSICLLFAGTVQTRENWMNYRWPFIAVVWFGPRSTPFPTSSVSELSQFLSLPVCRRSSLLTGKGGRGGRGAESHDRKKSWPSINRLILSGSDLTRTTEWHNIKGTNETKLSSNHTQRPVMTKGVIILIPAWQSNKKLYLHVLKRIYNWTLPLTVTFRTWLNVEFKTEVLKLVARSDVGASLPIT